MKDLESIERAIEAEVEDYVNELCAEEEHEFNCIDIDFTVDGVDYSATVDVWSNHTFTPCYEYDKFNQPWYMGRDVELDDFEYEISDLWDGETEEYIIKNGKTINQ